MRLMQYGVRQGLQMTTYKTAVNTLVQLTEMQATYKDMPFNETGRQYIDLFIDTCNEIEIDDVIASLVISNAIMFSTLAQSALIKV